MIYKKPSKLKKGDTVAIVSPSWGGPSVFPDVYENGLEVLREWGLELRWQNDKNNLSLFFNQKIC